MSGNVVWCVTCDTWVTYPHAAVGHIIEKGRRPPSGRERPTWEQYALGLARAAATRSEDPYVQVGACILRADNSVASLGFNGAPSGVNMDWSDRDERRKWIIHSEANALRFVRPGEGVLVASTLLPCIECLKLIRAQGILRVVYDLELDAATYDADEIRSVATMFGVSIQHIDV